MKGNPEVKHGVLHCVVNDKLILTDCGKAIMYVDEKVWQYDDPEDGEGRAFGKWYILWPERDEMDFQWAIAVPYDDALCNGSFACMNFKGGVEEFDTADEALQAVGRIQLPYETNLVDRGNPSLSPDNVVLGIRGPGYRCTTKRHQVPQQGNPDTCREAPYGRPIPPRHPSQNK
jgi:hypothetical protein